MNFTESPQCCSQEETIKLLCSREFPETIVCVAQSKISRYLLSVFWSILARQWSKAKASLFQSRAEVGTGRQEGGSGFSPFLLSCGPLQLLEAWMGCIRTAAGLHSLPQLLSCLGEPRQAFSRKVGDDTLLATWAVLCLKVAKSDHTNQQLPV